MGGATFEDTADPPAAGRPLVALPCLLVIFDDIKAAAYFLWKGRPRSIDTPHPILDAHRE